MFVKFNVYIGETTCLTNNAKIVLPACTKSFGQSAERPDAARPLLEKFDLQLSLDTCCIVKTAARWINNVS